MEGGWRNMMLFSGTLLLLVEVVALQKTDSSYTVDYILVTDLKESWEEARSFCRNTYDDLATIDDEDDNSAADRLDRDQDRSFWIGLHDDVDSWKWSLEDEAFYTGRDRGYRRWHGDQPDNIKGVERCVAMTTGGYWEDHGCTLQKPFICYNEKSKSPYALLAKGKSWLEAQSSCRQHFTDLASVTSLQDVTEIQELLRSDPAVQEVWIGLHRDSWKWTDGSSTSFRRWRPTNGTAADPQPCVRMQGGYWSDSPCSTRLNFLCQSLSPANQSLAPKPASTSPAVHKGFTVKMKMSTSSDLRDPSIRSQILQQLLAALNLQGVTDVELHWRTLSRDGREHKIN